MTSPVDVVNIALAEIGDQRSISSFNDNSTEAKVAKLLYQPKIDALFRAAHWNCARKQDNLTLLRAITINGVTTNDPPPVPWYYEYLYPSDCLAARYLLPQTQNSAISPPLTTFNQEVPYLYGVGQIPYVIANDKYPTGTNAQPTRVVLTNAEFAILVYTFRVLDPTQWDPQFLAAATSFLGAWFVNALGRNRALANDQAATAQGIIAQARISDGNEGVMAADHLPDWIVTRGYAGGTITNGLYYSPWSPIAFPGGLYF